MKRLFLYLLLVLTTTPLFSQSIQSPAEFLGYEIGTKFTRHHQVADYFEHVAELSDQVELFPYGKSFEGRPLLAVAVSSKENIQSLEAIRKGHLARIGLSDAKAFSDKELTFVWLSYNIHGDEAVSSEAALVTLEKLISKDKKVEEWLKEVIVIMDPCLNPDGRDRYVNWYNNVAMAQLNIDQNSEEHHSTWPGGRVNHYLFDLNRDWAWQVQVESQQRGVLYQHWMPHVHVDFHEMGINSPYFFAPAAHPLHESITPWQREFQHLVGHNHAGYFDDEGWTFYTKEIFDLFYPSYGDTWPIFNGAIGFTYEQGGSRDAGIAVLNDHGDTLTLKDRIAHHFTTSLSTIEVSYLNREKLKKEFKKYFNDAANSPAGKYKSYVIKGSNDRSRVKALLKLLDKQNIRYGMASGTNRNYTGFDYLNNQSGNFSLEKGDIVVSAYQPKSVLAEVLFDPKPNLEDSLTYDLTAWALPYVFEVETYATSERINPDEKAAMPAFVPNPQSRTSPVAYLAAWKDVQDVHFLSALLKENIKVRFSEKPLKANGKQFDRGTLIITRTHNKHVKNFDKKVVDIANSLEQPLDIANTGLSESGPDLGSGSVRYIKKPKIALVNGLGINANSYGELWHYFDQVLEYPVSVINMNYAQRINWSDFDVVVLPSGNYSKISKKLMDFAATGGKLIAVEGAMHMFTAENTQLAIATEEMNKQNENGIELPESKLRRYENAERSYISSSVAGSIYKVHLDDSHPLAFGEDSHIHIMKRNNRAYPYIDDWNVGVIKEDGHVSGFVGSQLKTELTNTLAIGAENYGNGQIIYFTDSPVFRGFWHSGQLLMGNAVFFVGQ